MQAIITTSSVDKAHVLLRGIRSAIGESQPDVVLASQFAIRGAIRHLQVIRRINLRDNSVRRLVAIDDGVGNHSIYTLRRTAMTYRIATHSDVVGNGSVSDEGGVINRNDGCLSISRFISEHQRVLQRRTIQKDHVPFCSLIVFEPTCRNNRIIHSLKNT